MDIIYKHSDQNYILDAAPGIRLDITDIMADLLHLCDRYGLDHDDIIDKARNSYAGDSEDGPRVNCISEMAMPDIIEIRSAFINASDEEIEALILTITDALEGESNDAEHDALSDVADFIGLNWNNPYDEDDDGN